MVESLIFVVNPGSASRKYSLFVNGNRQASIHFEIEDGLVVGNLYYADTKYTVKYDDANLGNAPHRILPLLYAHDVIKPTDKITAIGIRIVAPSQRFTVDELVTDRLMAALDELHQETPLHITTALLEIRQLRVRFKGVPIIAISDSAFHITKPAHALHYGIDPSLIKKFGIERYGYHGISVGSIINYLKTNNIMMPKTIVCHLGSGCSVTAVDGGKSVDNTMGYSPSEGLMMATRSGDIDVSAALVIKRELGLTDNGLEQYLDKKSGLLGVSGTSDDIRQLIISENKGDERAKLALDMYVYRIQQAIGRMAAGMGGVNCLVLTGTISERSIIIRARILKQLGFLGFECDPKINRQTFEPKVVANIASSNSKPILIIATDEDTEIAKRAEKFISNRF